MRKIAVFAAAFSLLLFQGDAFAAKKSQEIRPDKALEEAVKIELGKRIEERELPDPMKDAAKTGKELAPAAGEATAGPAEAKEPETPPSPAGAGADETGSEGREETLNPMDVLLENEREKAAVKADERVREYEERKKRERERIEMEQGRPAQEGEATDSSQLSQVISGGFTGSDIETGKEEKNPDLSTPPEVTMYPKGQEAIAPNDAAIRPEGRKIEYYVFTTALDRQKWRAKRLDRNIRAFIDGYVEVRVIPSAAPASSLAYIFNQLWDMGEKRKALSFLDWAYEYGRNVITMQEVDRWLSENRLPKTAELKIESGLLEKRLAELNAKIDAMDSLELGWSPSRAANWHDGVVFVDGKFDPELFMRVYGEANPEKAKNFLEPHEVPVDDAPESAGDDSK